MIHPAIHFPPEVEIKHDFREQHSPLFNSIASHATLATFAAGILSSTYLAYKAPNKWWLCTLSIGVINLHTLPHFLQSHNLFTIKIAFITHITALSFLLLGGINYAFFSLSNNMLSSFKTTQFSSALFNAFLLTGLMGYVTPFFHSALKNAYNFLHNPILKTRLEILFPQFSNKQKEKGIASNHIERFILQLSLFNPDFILEICKNLTIPLPHYAWLMAATISESNPLNKLSHLLVDMIAVSIDQTKKELSDEEKNNYLVALNIILNSLKKEDKSLAFQKVIQEAPGLAPYFMSNLQFLQLLKDYFLEEANASIKATISQFSKWKTFSDKHQTLVKDVVQLLSEVENLQQLKEKEEKNLTERYEKHHKEYGKLRQNVEKIFKCKHEWQNFSTLWANDKELPFERSKDFLAILHDSKLWKEIDATYKEIIGATTPGATSPTIHDQLQLINNKLITMRQEEGEEEISPIFYLATHCSFIQKDYDDLQLWLDVASPHDLEITMEKIGLATKEDLYEKGILSHLNPLPSKLEVRKSLHHYIKNQTNRSLIKRIKTKNEIKRESSLRTLMENVSRLIYYTISSGLILIPVLINPYAGGVGFSLGLCFFTLQRFGAPCAKNISDFSEELLNLFSFGFDISPLLNRRIFSLSQRRERANEFVLGNFYEKIRMINQGVFSTLLLSSFSIRQVHMTSIIQGIAFAREIHDFF